VACLDENTIVAFFESRLDAAEALRVEDHLGSCESCRALLSAYAEMARPAQRTPETQLSATEAAPAPAAEPKDDRAELGRRIAQAQAAKRVGTVLSGRWKLDRLIGIGGMAQVYAATHRNGRACAVKVMRPELAVEPLFVERFLREGYVANKVEHPGAVAILDDDVAPDGAPFLVMELLRGRTLRERLEGQGPLPLGVALRLTEDVLDVLAAAHAHGIIHRDIKPDNLFETDAGTVKVLDFGIARLRERVGGPPDTQSGMTMGTVGYMAPEQARGVAGGVDMRSDVWAVGATLFTLLTGRLLHGASSTNEALLLAMTAPIAPMHTLAPLPPDVCALLDKALAFDKAARFESCIAMQEAVRSVRRALGGSLSLERTAASSGPVAHADTVLAPGQTLLGVSTPGTSPMLEAPAAAMAGPSASATGARGARSWARIGVWAAAAVILLGGAVVAQLVRTQGEASGVPQAAVDLPAAPTGTTNGWIAVPLPAELVDTASSARPAASEPSASRDGASRRSPVVARPRKPESAPYPPPPPFTPPPAAAPPGLDPLGPRR